MPWKSIELEVRVWKSFGLLEIHCQTARAVQYMYGLVGWLWEFLGLFCPARSVLGLGFGLEKVLENFWNLTRQNLCEPCKRPHAKIEGLPLAAASGGC